jgi:hypothetical protein
MAEVGDRGSKSKVLREETKSKTTGTNKQQVQLVVTVSVTVSSPVLQEVQCEAYLCKL